MNAIEFLVNEHTLVRNQLEEIGEKLCQVDSRKQLFAKLAQNLLRHERMEHEIWYPHFKNKLPTTVKHLVKEEVIAEKEIEKIENLKSDAAWEEHFLKFKRDVEHHATEEEEQLFPEVKKILSEAQLKEIGASMVEFKKQY